MPECTFEQGQGGEQDWIITTIGGQQLHILKKEIYQDYRWY